MATTCSGALLVHGTAAQVRRVVEGLFFEEGQLLAPRKGLEEASAYMCRYVIYMNIEYILIEVFRGLRTEPPREPGAGPMPRSADFEI